jgi:hypothetical protein
LALAHVWVGRVSMGLGGARYVFEALPLAIVLGAGVLTEGCRRLSGSAADPERAPAGLAWSAAIFVAYGAVTVVSADLPKLRNYFGVDTAMYAVVETAAERPALVFMPVGPSGGDTSRFVAMLAQNEPLLDGDIIYARDLGERNRLLARARPGRHAYRWDPERFALEPIDLATDPAVDEAP